MTIALFSPFAAAHKKASLLGIFLLICTGCIAKDQNIEHSFTFRMKVVDFQSAAQQITTAIAAELAAGGYGIAGEPAAGAITNTPDPAHPGGSLMECSSGKEPGPEDDRCILLNDKGDFIRFKAVTWESEAAHFYYVYILPRSIFASVNPVRDYIGIDFYLLNEPTRWEEVDQAIRNGISALGGRPYRR